MLRIDQSALRGKVRDLPISRQLEDVLLKAGAAAGIDIIFVTSGGQPGTSGRSVGSTRHNGGRAADLQLIVQGRTLSFSDLDGGDTVERFVTAAAANGAIGIGAGLAYMGSKTMHIGFGATVDDHRKIVWGKDGKSKFAPQWLRDAAERGWNNPPAWAFATHDGSTTEEHGEEHVEDHVIREHAFDPRDVPSRFPIDVILAAQATQRLYGIPTSVTLAQWALESAYGKRMPAGSNNPFGIKARTGEPSVMALTKEVIHGRTVSVRASFRAFPTLDDAFIRHATLLATGDRYKTARLFMSDPNRFADALTGVYATDPNYGTLLKSIMRSNDLYRFDKLDGDPSSHETEREDDVTPPLQQGSEDMTGVKALQQRLVELGYPVGDIDGKFGRLTAGALLAFQNENGLPTTSVVDTATRDGLKTAQHRQLDEKRIKAGEKELAADGSRIVIDAGRSRILSWITGGVGALGLGNSAIINAGGGAPARTPGVLPENMLSFLTEVQKLTPTSSAEVHIRLAGLARTLAEQLGGPILPPEAIQILDQLRKTIPPDVLARNPDVIKTLDLFGKMTAAKTPAMNTIFDVLPTLVSSGGALEATMKGIAAVGGSVLPGFGGSLAVLGVGLAGRYFANRIAAARVEDHNTGNNIKR